jgi:ribosomal subunit interface protein
MIPIQITIRDVQGSAALEEVIRKKAEKLTQYYQHIKNFHVVVELPQKRKRQGKLYSVHIDLGVPGKELVVDKKQDEDVYIAVRNAFNALKRQVDEYAHKRRGDVKNHVNATHENRAGVTLEMQDDPLIH